MPLASPTAPNLPLPANLPLLHKPHRKNISPYGGAPRLVLAPTQPPNYGPLVTSTHPPSSSSLSKPSMEKGGLVPPSAGLAPPRLADIAPIQPGTSASPAGLVQPPLSPHTSSKAHYIKS